MCAEKIEEISETSTPPAAAPSKTSWVPALVVLLLFPVLSYVISDFVLFPRLQIKFEETVKQINALPTTLSEASPQETSTQAEKSTYEIRDIMSNVNDNGQVRYARVSFVLEGRIENFAEIMKKNEARLIDATLDVFSVLSVDDLQNTNLKSIIKNQLLQRFESVLNKNCIEDLFFSQFVIK